MFNFFKRVVDSSIQEQKSSFETMSSPKDQLIKIYNKPVEFSHRKDNYRSPSAYEDGGIACDDPNQIEKLRSVGKEMIKLIGKKLLSGELNLTKISFPIKACHPKTALLNSVQSCKIFPHYMNLAAQINHPLEKFKLVTTAFVASNFYLPMFLKPLNPILGETLQAQLADGTKIYSQQISHHPPISYFLIYGPEQSYQFSGYYDFDVSPGLNSLSLKNKGKRKIVFKDGTQIQATFPEGLFKGTFLGTTRIQETSKFTIKDEKNNLQLEIEYDCVRKMPSDFFDCHIKAGEKKISHVFGTYCGFIEIDGIRYWDARDFDPYQIKMVENKLDSDWSHRPDLQALMKNQMQLGQKQKQALEQFQRKDAKLRKKYKKKHQKD